MACRSNSVRFFIGVDASVEAWRDGGIKNEVDINDGGEMDREVVNRSNCQVERGTLSQHSEGLHHID